MRDNSKGGALTETTFLVLLALRRPNHGYGVMQLIERETGGRVSLGAGTLYGAISALCQKGWIAPAGPDDSRRRKYVITPLGEAAVRNERKRIDEIATLAARLMGGEKDE